MPTLSKHGKKIGRPAGAAHRDFRPRVVALIQKYRILEHAVKLYDREKETMTVKDQLQYAKTLIDFAIAASPKTIETPDAGNSIQLIINGLRQTHHGEVVQLEDHPASEAPCPVQHAPAPRALPEAVSDSRARAPHVPTSNRPRPVVDSSPPAPEPVIPPEHVLRVPFGPRERTEIPAEWRTPLFPAED